MPRWFDPVAPEPPYFCVVGSPITHSRSPEIHALFGRQTGISLRYDRVEVTATNFAAALAEFVAAGGRGMNVTVPLKEEACAAADERLDTAAATGAANTIRIAADGRAQADNTDGRGLVTDLSGNHGVGLRDNRILLLGAGGAARGVIPDLLAASPAEIIVANRTVAKAETLARLFGERGNIAARAYDELEPEPRDLIINATSMSLGGESPPLPPAVVDTGSVCYDMMYTATGRTIFLDWCAARGARTTLDGLGMLVEQAAFAFEFWHGVRPETAPVIAALR